MSFHDTESNLLYYLYKLLSFKGTKMKLEELVLRFSYDVVPSNVYWRSSWLRVYFNNYSCESLFSDCVFRTVDILNEITLRWVIMWWPQTGHLKRVLSIPYFFGHLKWKMLAKTMSWRSLVTKSLIRFSAAS